MHWTGVSTRDGGWGGTVCRGNESRVESFPCQWLHSRVDTSPFPVHTLPSRIILVHFPPKPFLGRTVGPLTSGLETDGDVPQAPRGRAHGVLPSKNRLPEPLDQKVAGSRWGATSPKGSPPDRAVPGGNAFPSRLFFPAQGTDQPLKRKIDCAFF